ncbi:hypothetical protein [Ideonella livida]|uniref:Uncharacterized protein n=1 Tax=Ideonella livida TaxID=2707176 RepID=A0A7C9PFL8_9BURK|nr:hypothetical protein [Ideonella livida]NDY90391.1 hypothetical protein [Ideonella livida]
MPAEIDPELLEEHYHCVHQLAPRTLADRCQSFDPFAPDASFHELNLERMSWIATDDNLQAGVFATGQDWAGAPDFDSRMSRVQAFLGQGDPLAVPLSDIPPPRGSAQQTTDSLDRLFAAGYQSPEILGDALDALVDLSSWAAELHQDFGLQDTLLDYTQQLAAQGRLQPPGGFQAFEGPDLSLQESAQTRDFLTREPLGRILDAWIRGYVVWQP